MQNRDGVHTTAPRALRVSAVSIAGAECGLKMKHTTKFAYNTPLLYFIT